MRIKFAPPQSHFWITNISKKMITLEDLNVDIYPMRTLNLLDKKHYKFTNEQLNKSALSGSLYKKQKYVIIRQIPPGETQEPMLPLDRNTTIPTRQRSAVKVEEIKYEELNLPDEEYAEKDADMAENDRLGKWKK